jgi:hypothetical protein
MNATKIPERAPQVTCPACGVPAGRKCVGLVCQRGKEMSTPHTDRTVAEGRAQVAARAELIRRSRG